MDVQRTLLKACACVLLLRMSGSTVCGRPGHRSLRRSAARGV